MFYGDVYEVEVMLSEYEHITCQLKMVYIKRCYAPLPPLQLPPHGHPWRQCQVKATPLSPLQYNELCTSK